MLLLLHPFCDTYDSVESFLVLASAVQRLSWVAPDHVYEEVFSLVAEIQFHLTKSASAG